MRIWRRFSLVVEACNATVVGCNCAVRVIGEYIRAVPHSGDSTNVRGTEKKAFSCGYPA